MSWTDTYDGPTDETYFTKLHNEDPEPFATPDDAARREPVPLAPEVSPHAPSAGNGAPEVTERDESARRDEPARTIATRTGAPDLADYLSRIRDFTTKYVVFPSEHEPVAVALWVAHAQVVEIFETSPILAATSAEMRSGKTRVLDVLELLVPTPFRAITPSAAVVYSMLAQRPRPTLLLDEVDAIFGPKTAANNEPLRAILNAGNRQGTPVPRVNLEGRKRNVEFFDVYGPKAIAGIGDLPATVSDRSIVLRMKRRAPSEPLAKFRTRIARDEAKSIVLDWATVVVNPIADVPDELNDRAADSWEPLLAVADAAGGSWPSIARMAAVALGSDEDTPASVGMRLLAEIQMVFEQDAHLTTAELLRRLHDLEDAPWGDWYGSPLSGRGLAKLLGPYRVAPIKRRVHGEQSRGYFRTDFTDAWARYVRHDPIVPSVPSAPAQASGTDGTDGTDISSPPDYRSVWGDDLVEPAT